MIITKTVLSCVKIIGETLSLFAPPGVAAGIGLGATVLQKLMVDESQMAAYWETHLLDVKILTHGTRYEIKNICSKFDSQFKMIEKAVYAIPDNNESSREENSESWKMLKSLKMKVKEYAEQLGEKTGIHVDPGILKELIGLSRNFLDVESKDLDTKIDNAKILMKKKLTKARRIVLIVPVSIYKLLRPRFQFMKML